MPTNLSLVQPDSQSPLLGPSWPGKLASSSSVASQQRSRRPLQRPQYCAVNRVCHPGVLWSAQLRSLAFREFRYRSLSAVFARILFNVARCSASVFAYARETSTLAIFAIPGLSQDENPILARPRLIPSNAVTAAARHGRYGPCPSLADNRTM